MPESGSVLIVSSSTAIPTYSQNAARRSVVRSCGSTIASWKFNYAPPGEFQCARRRQSPSCFGRREVATPSRRSRTYVASPKNSSSTRPVPLDKSSLDGNTTHILACPRSWTSGSSTPRAKPRRSSAAYMSLNMSGKSSVWKSSRTASASSLVNKYSTHNPPNTSSTIANISFASSSMNRPRTTSAVFDAAVPIPSDPSKPPTNAPIAVPGPGAADPMAAPAAAPPTQPAVPPATPEAVTVTFLKSCAPDIRPLNIRTKSTDDRTAVVAIAVTTLPRSTLLT